MVQDKKPAKKKNFSHSKKKKNSKNASKKNLQNKTSIDFDKVKHPFLLEELNKIEAKKEAIKAHKLSNSAKDLVKKIEEKKSSDIIKTKSFTTFQKAIRNSRVYGNSEKRKVAADMLERYTGHEIEDFQPQIILTNFHYYMERFNSILDDHHYTQGSAFKASSSKKAQVTIIEFGIGSAMAALIMELVAVVEPKAVLFLGMCGAVHKSLKVGDFILPIGAIRAESVSQHFMPPQVPALPTFKVQKFASQVLVEHGVDYRTGMVHSTDLRFWEFDQNFKNQLYAERVNAVEMECAALFITGFASKVSIGALLLVSDCPLKRNGIKTKKSASTVFRKYTDMHIELGIEIMSDIAERGDAIRHYLWS
ncbi:MAG: AMP nucleosidase [Halobacteriovoraceae bacterium]|nr:AMP nucleosidase [Halobacteriovoraceae bacterium]